MNRKTCSKCRKNPRASQSAPYCKKCQRRYHKKRRERLKRDNAYKKLQEADKAKPPDGRYIDPAKGTISIHLYNKKIDEMRQKCAKTVHFLREENKVLKNAIKALAKEQIKRIMGTVEPPSRR